jgi:hypothetical protein
MDAGSISRKSGMNEYEDDRSQFMAGLLARARNPPTPVYAILALLGAIAGFFYGVEQGEHHPRYLDTIIGGLAGLILIPVVALLIRLATQFVGRPNGRSISRSQDRRGLEIQTEAPASVESAADEVSVPLMPLRNFQYAMINDMLNDDLNDDVDRFMAELKAFEVRRHELINEVLRQKESANQAFDAKLAKLGYRGERSEAQSSSG